MIVSEFALSKNILKPENSAKVSLEACEANHALNDFRKFKDLMVHIKKPNYHHAENRQQRIRDPTKAAFFEFQVSAA